MKPKTDTACTRISPPYTVTIWRRVDLSPPEALQSGSSVTFTRAGVTATGAPLSLILPGAASVEVFLKFDAEDDLAFTLDAASPGDLIGELTVQLAAEEHLPT